MNVVIYARYSSHNQTEQSIDGQIDECKKFIELNNYKLIDTYIDRAKSGTKDDREQFQKMLKDSEKNLFNGIIVYQLDRFARNRYDSATYKAKLRKNNVRVFSARENITDDASGILMESVLEGMAEYFSVELGQKVKRGMKINAENCFYNGGTVPLGFKLEYVDTDITDASGKIVKKQKFVIDDDNSVVVKKIFEMYTNGHLMSEIIKYLNDNGYKNNRNNEFNKNSIRKILLNKRYIGIYSYAGVETIDGIPRIIDNETFTKVNDMLLKNKKAPARARARNEYLLTTKLFCGHCKDMMIGHSGTSKNKKLYNYYKCSNAIKKECNKKPVSKDYIEDLVVEKAREILTDENINTIAQEVVKRTNAEKNNTNITRIENLLKENKKQKNNLFSSLKICTIDSVKQSIFEEIEKMELEYNKLDNQLKTELSNQIKLTVPQVKFFLHEIKNGSIDDIKYKRTLINILIYKVYLFDNGELTILFNTQNKQYKDKIPCIEDIESSFNGSNALPIELNIFIDINYIKELLLVLFLLTK